MSARDWLVVVRGTPHDQIVTALANAGFLHRSQAVVPTGPDAEKPGLDAGRYEAHVRENTSKDARSRVEEVLAAYQTTIVGVQPA